MFGTLHVTDDVRKPVPLQFVETRDLSSALSRNSRDRPHISCEFCRARKVRCSGEPSGCNRCQAVGVECRYPPREPRRKAAQGHRKMSGDDQTTSKNGKPQQPQRDQTPAQEQENAFPRYSEPNEAGPLLSAMSPQMLEQEMMESEYPYQNPSDGGFDINLASRCGGEQSVKDGLDEWLDLNHILDTSLPSSSGGADNLGYFDTTMIDPGLMDDSMERGDLLISGTANALYPLPQLEAARSESSGSTASKTNTSTSTRSSNRSRRSTLGTSSSYTNYSQHRSRSPVSFSSSPSRTHVSRSSRGLSCRCLQLSACLVEELGAKAAASDRAGMDVLLGDLRGALAQCATILDCERCVTARENNMLLAMAAKYMSTMCECVAVCYAEMRRTSSCSNGGVQLNHESDYHHGGDRPDEIRFSTYLIENGRERMHVLGCLVDVQISEFAQMVARLKTRPGVRRGHLMLLTEAGSKVNTLQAMLRGGGGSGIHSIY
ncbi:hypothetical protein QBC44DRAFT_383326 [Cladorrhinum sp. PSN332]|nr:hypothetical protein QBC44DRAFT_383326 [Cladorrhinum sp. PSN332]